MDRSSAIKNNAKDDVDCEIMIAPATPFLHMAQDKLKGTPIKVVAQNVSQYAKGAYTGETSVEMLKSIGVDTVLVGHSERRDIFKETDDQLAKKVDAAIANGMRVIFCCGEHLEQRKDGTYFKTVTHQITNGLLQLEPGNWSNVILAYEPVWAIGTGETATPVQAQEMHEHIRKFVADKFGQEIADDLSILYGGSVKPANAREIFAQPDVDGGLVGGASLDAQSFLEIANSF